MTKKHFEALINRFSDVERLAKEGGESGGGGHILAFLLKIIVTNLKKKTFLIVVPFTVHSTKFFFANQFLVLLCRHGYDQDVLFSRYEDIRIQQPRQM